MAIKCEHTDGDSKITLVEEHGVFVVTLSNAEGPIRVERTTSYVRAVYEYSQMICYEMACYANLSVDRTNIEAIPHLNLGSW